MAIATEKAGMSARRVAPLMLLSTLAGGAQMAQATDVFRLEGFGAISRAMGGTAVAQDVGPAGMMTNPATLALMRESEQVMGGLDLITTEIDVKNKASGETASSRTHGNNRGPYFAPELAYTKRVGAWTFGAGAFAQGGLGTEYGNRSFLSRASGGVDTGLENSSRLLVLDIPLAASFQVNDKLAIGGGIDAMWQGLNLDLLLGADQVGSLIGNGRASGSLVPVLGGLPDLRGAHFSLTQDKLLGSGVDAWGFGGRLGMVYKAAPDTTVGASYTIKSRMNDLSGRATLTAVDAVAGPVPLAGKIKIQDFQMPSSLNLGISHRVTPQWLLAADLSQVFWKDAMKDIKVKFLSDGGGDINIRLPQDYKNQTVLALGTAYQLHDRLTLRAGLRVASQALRSSTLFAVIPATPKTHLSAGFTYALSNQSKLDFAYSHALEETMSNTSLPNTSAPIQVKHSQNNVVLGYRYSF
ncbi:MAG: outer membrane protein transport protein [Burkholderiales bacterium]|nr:outer membrane protein transport protein [Burkholderiales bacterium]